MEKSEHVMLSGNGAEQFAKLQGLEIVNPKYFWTENRWKSLQKSKRIRKLKNPKAENSKPDYFIVDQKFGTVGCVALDQFGNLAAGTSTGGMTNKNMEELAMHRLLVQELMLMKM